MEKIFAIYDSDVLYTTRLMGYLNKKNISGFQISVFTKKENLEEFLANHKAEILLLADQCILQECSLKNIMNIFRFSEKVGEEADMDDRLVRKYQPAPKMIDEVLKKYNHTEIVRQTDSQHQSNKMITIFSPKPGAETLSFAWSISTLLSYHAKTLFVPMELFPTPGFSTIVHSEFYLSEFIYYLKENPAQIIRLKDMLKKEDYLSFLTGVMHGSDLLSLNRVDIYKMIEVFRDLTEYNTIILYAGFFNEAIVELMKVSDTVLVPTLDTAYDKAVSDEWEEQMNRGGINTDTIKFCRVLLPMEDKSYGVPLNQQSLISSATWEIAKNYVNRGIGEGKWSN